jgi:hypothetical protein
MSLSMTYLGIVLMIQYGLKIASQLGAWKANGMAGGGA